MATDTLQKKRWNWKSLDTLMENRDDFMNFWNLLQLHFNSSI